MMLTRVVLIMPVYNEARHLPRVLQSIASQTFDRGRIYFVAVDGNSEDGSIDILRDWLAQSGISGAVLTNPSRRIPVSLNLGVAQATVDDIILRLDAHTVYEPAYVAETVRSLENAAPDVACIGCAQLPLPDGTFADRIVGALYTNPMGLGGADFRVGGDVREVDNIYLGAWRPGLLQLAGGFDETMVANEDAELSARLRRRGYRILRVPLPCRFLVKRGLIASVRQWHRYGYWRAKMLKRNPQFIRRRHVISPAAMLLAVALAISPARALLLAAFCLYSILVFRYRSREEPLLVTLASLLFFPVLQCGYALGMLMGALTATPGATMHVNHGNIARS